MDETKVIDMAKMLEQSTETTLVGTPEHVKQVQVQMLCANARTMCMMYRITNESYYLARAKASIDQARSIKRGFVRPRGVLSLEVA